MVEAFLAYSLHNSPRLPTLHQRGDCHILAVDASEQKRELRRVDAETADLHNPHISPLPCTLEQNPISRLCFLQCLVTIHSNRENCLRHTSRLRGRVLYLYRSGHGISVCSFSIQVLQVGHITRQSVFVIVLLKPPHISSARISFRYQLASVVSNSNSHSQIGHLALYRLMFGSFVIFFAILFQFYKDSRKSAILQDSRIVLAPCQ